MSSGYIAQWLERLTADQQVCSNLGVPNAAELTRPSARLGRCAAGRRAADVKGKFLDIAATHDYKEAQIRRGRLIGTMYEIMSQAQRKKGQGRVGK